MSEAFRFTRSVYVEMFDTWATVLAVQNDTPAQINTSNIQLSTNLPFQVDSNSLFEDERYQWELLMRGKARDTDIVGVAIGDNFYARPIKRGNLTLVYRQVLRDILLLGKHPDRPSAKDCTQDILSTMFVSGLHRMVDMFNATVEEPMERADFANMVDAASCWAAEAEVDPRAVVGFVQTTRQGWAVPHLDDFEIEKIVSGAYKTATDNISDEFVVRPSASFLLRLKESAGGTRTGMSDLLAIPGVTEKLILARFQQWMTEKHNKFLHLVKRSVHGLLKTNANPILLTVTQLAEFTRILSDAHLSQDELVELQEYVGSGVVDRGMENVRAVTEESLKSPIAIAMARGTQVEQVMDQSFLEAGPSVSEKEIRTAASIANIIYRYTVNNKKSTTDSFMS